MTAKRCVVTGAAGFIGSHVIPLLLDDPAISHVTGIDVTPLQIPSHPKLTSVQKDIRDPGISGFLQNADCLVHLAFIVRNIHDDAKAREINVGGTENLLKACESLSVKKIVFTSSISVYGYDMQNEGNLNEDSPLNPAPDHVYSVCKALIERMLIKFQKKNPAVITCTLRPSLVVGPSVDNTFTRLLRSRYLFLVQGFDPIIQTLHIKDMADAICLAVKKDFSGVFNVGPDDAVPFSQVCREFNIRRMHLPRPLFSLGLRLLYKYHISSIPPQSIGKFLYSLTIDSKRFRQSFQWQPAFSTIESISQLRGESD